MATDFTPASNTPEAAVTRGEGFYRLYQSVTNVALGDVYFDTTENIVAITMGSTSAIPAAQIQFRSKGTSQVTYIYVSTTTPWFGIIPSQPAASSPSSVAIRITPVPNRLYTGATLELLLWFKPPAFLQQARSPFTSTIDGVAVHLDAGATTESVTVKNSSWGQKKMSVYMANCEATTVTMSVRTARTVYYTTSGATVPLTQTATAIYSYTTNGVSGDFCTAVLDIDPFVTVSLSFQKTVGVAGDVLYSVFFYDVY